MSQLADQFSQSILIQTCCASIPVVLGFSQLLLVVEVHAPPEQRVPEFVMSHVPPVSKIIVPSSFSTVNYVDRRSVERKISSLS